MNKYENPFDEIESASNNDSNDSDQDENGGSGESETKRERAKYFVVDVKYVASNQRELREYLEANDDLAGSCRLVKGNEIFAKRKTVYTF